MESLEVELQISRFKRAIDDTLTRYYESGEGDPEELWNMRMRLAEISLQNCKAIARYVREKSGPAATELEMRLRSALRELQPIKKTREIGRLNDWYKQELAPLLNKSEQAGYLVIMTNRRAGGDDSRRFAWQLQDPPAEREHLALYGKTSDQFRYLNQTCPVCGGRIDEKGWCGCGNIGGG